MDRAEKTVVPSLARVRFIAYVALSMAVMAVSAWVTVPLGPVPFTLQLFALVFAILMLNPKECMAAVAGYLVLGAIGVPVFSGMRGGIGMLAGPTGGFLWGFLLGAAAAVLFLAVAKKRTVVVEYAAGVIFTAVSYLCGWAQFMAVTGASPLEAVLVTIAPFVVVDLVKIAAAVGVVRVVRKAVGRTA